VVRKLFIIFMMLSGLSSISFADNSYLRTLQQQASALKLAEKPSWQRLLHYQPRFFNQSAQSLITYKKFFFNSEGFKHPDAELSATLTQFFISNGEDNNSAQCRFPARFQWLKEQLKLDHNYLPSRKCNALQDWLTELEVSGISLIFPVAYLNNPASMFGHSFLKLDKQQSSKGSQLLASTVNYAAMTAKERGLNFVLKGLFGGYQGKFTLAPYYLLLKEYADLDNRDLWEYQLNFTPQEIQRLLLHLWELLPANFDYYFINKNCSYQLLSLLEVARPDLNLSSQFKFDAIPADTVRAIINQSGLLKQSNYRPALATVLAAKAGLLNNIQQNYAKALAVGEIAVDSSMIKTLAIIKQAQVLELAVDYLSYLNASKVKYKQAINQELVYQLLAARSLLKVTSVKLNIPVPLARPDEGHAGNMAELAYGYDGRQPFVEIGYRWAYHDLNDPSEGFVKGAEVDFFKSSLRYNLTTQQFTLEAIDLLKLTSLPNFNTFIRPFSWQVLLGVKQMRFADNKRYLTGVVKIGGGISYYPSENSLFSLNILTRVLFNHQFQQYTAVSIGTGLYFHYDPLPAWRITLNTDISYYLQGTTQMRYHYQLKQRISLSKSHALSLDLNYQREFSHSDFGLQLGLQFYF